MNIINIRFNIMEETANCILFTVYIEINIQNDREMYLSIIYV